MERPIILFDGICNFCNATVNFIIDRDPTGTILFAALQSKKGQELLEGFNLPADSLDTFVLIEGERVFTQSCAALRVCRLLRGSWKLLYAFVLIPRPLRDWAYGMFSRNRYRWFGRSDVCRVPTEHDRDRFL